jgi:glutathione S-transferase
MQTTLSINLIATNPEIRGGRPYIIGTTITVADIAIAKIFHRQEPDAAQGLRSAGALLRAQGRDRRQYPGAAQTCGADEGAACWQPP